MITPLHLIDGAKRQSALAAGLHDDRPRTTSSAHSAAVGRNANSCAMTGRLFASEHGLGQSEILSRAGRNRQPVACVREAAGRPLHRGAPHRDARTGSRCPPGRTPVARLPPDGRRRAGSRSRQGDRERALPISRALPTASTARRTGSCGSTGRRRCRRNFSRRAFCRFRDSTPACASSWSARLARSVSVRAKPIWRCGWRGRARKGSMARRLAVVAYGLYGSRDYLARCGEDDQEYLGYDDSLDHLPQQRWLKKLAGDRGSCASIQRHRQSADGGPRGAGACRAALCHGARRTRTGQRADAIAAADPRAMAAVPPRYRPYACGSRGDRPHHRDHDGAKAAFLEEQSAEISRPCRQGVIGWK